MIAMTLAKRRQHQHPAALHIAGGGKLTSNPRFGRLAATHADRWKVTGFRLLATQTYFGHEAGSMFTPASLPAGREAGSGRHSPPAAPLPRRPESEIRP